MRRQGRALILGGVAAVVIAVVLAYLIRWRMHPSACPYRGWRFTLDLPRPPWIGRGRLLELLAPRAGQRILEVGPGTGYYALEVARWITPGGTLDVLDLQQEMLDHTMRRASDLHVGNIIPTRGDAQALPYPDNIFDAAYTALTLGEIPSQNAALLELHRVLKPGGRLVVGESFPDPHMVTLDSLRSQAEEATFHFERRLGGKLGYFASFRA
jgi:ubiquinone/menaquinone biosynthesis C-methylase UbiE